MSTLWANVDRGLKSTEGQQRSGPYSLISHKKFTQPHHPLQEKIRQVSIFPQFCFIPGEQMSTLWANGDWGLKSTSGQQSSEQYSLTSQKSLPRPTFVFQKKFTKSAFFHFLLHSRWPNVHFMGKWRQGLKIDLGATKQRTVLFDLTRKVYPDHPSSSRKKSLSRHFFTFCFIPGYQMSTLWANVDRGLKSTAGQQRSGPYSLISHKKFTQPHHPLQEKIRQVSIFSQFCFIPGEQMSTLWANGDWGLKSTSGQQSSEQYSLTSQKSLPRPTFIFQKKITKSAFFHLLLHSRWPNVHFMGKWRQGLKIDLGATKQRTVLFDLTRKVYPDHPSSSRKNSLNRNFFTFCFIPGDQMYTLWANGDRGLKSTLGQ